MKPNRRVSSPFQQASTFLEASPHPRAKYADRTSRNSFWVGGEPGQQKIRNLKIAVAGLGGIGGMIAETLVRAGVGHLRIADLDTIEATNINRQVAARQSTLGRNKAHAMTEHLRSIADDYELVVYDQGVQPEMVEEFVDGCDAIVDEIDVFALDRKLALHRAARERGQALYTAYCVGMGVNFYKFQGTDYKLEDFLGSDRSRIDKPSGSFLLETIASPMPPYIDAKKHQQFERTVDTGCAPIFGPVTLLGHAMVSMRILIDLMGSRMGELPRTPVMPEYLSIDAGDMSIRTHRAPRRR